MSSKFIHAVADVRISFPFKAEYYSIVQIDHICLSFHPVPNSVEVNEKMILYISFCFYTDILSKSPRVNV